jgi:hypothetical protein
MHAFHLSRISLRRYCNGRCTRWWRWIGCWKHSFCSYYISFTSGGCCMTHRLRKPSIDGEKPLDSTHSTPAYEYWNDPSEAGRCLIVEQTHPQSSCYKRFFFLSFFVIPNPQSSASASRASLGWLNTTSLKTSAAKSPWLYSSATNSPRSNRALAFSLAFRVITSRSIRSLSRVFSKTRLVLSIKEGLFHVAGSTSLYLATAHSFSA